MASTTVPYAVACTCPSTQVSGISVLQDRTMSVSHELVEAATDPFLVSRPAWQGVDDDHLAWALMVGAEVADMCTFNRDAFYVPPDGKYTVQRSWSNAAAARLENPCVPQPTAVPYFNAAPVLDPVSYRSSDGARSPSTQGVALRFGESKTIDVPLFSSASTARPWSVGVFSFEDLYGGDPSNLLLALDKTTGRNGDVLHLTLTARRFSGGYNADAFVLLSQYGNVGDPDFQVNLAMGLVVNAPAAPDRDAATDAAPGGGRDDGGAAGSDGPVAACASGTGASESITAAACGTTPGTTAETYDGVVTLAVDGVLVDAPGQALRDAFYIVDPNDPSRSLGACPDCLRFNRFSEGTCVCSQECAATSHRIADLLADPYPPFQPSHHYAVRLDLGSATAERLNIGMNDCGCGDNAGTYTIAVGRCAP